MIGKILLLAASVATVSGWNAEGGWVIPPGTDPNSLSCDPKGQIFLLLPSYEDCGEFYMCANGNEVLMQCPLGTIFDFHLQVCNYPWATECILRGDRDHGVGTEEGSGEGPDWTESKDDSHDRPRPHADLLSGAELHELSDQAVAELNCAVPHTDTRLSPHRGDCQRYWRCVSGVAEASFCSDGLYFNPKTLACDFEANVVCARDAHEELGEEFIRY